jgi:flagellar protein FlaG
VFCEDAIGPEVIWPDRLAQMQIGPISRIDPSELRTSQSQSQQHPFEAGELARAVKLLNQSNLFGDRRELSFRWDADSHRPIVRIVDRQSGEVIQEIPSQELLRMTAEMEKSKAEGRS